MDIQLTFTVWSVEMLKVLVAPAMSETGEGGAKDVILGVAGGGVGVGAGVKVGMGVGVGVKVGVGPDVGVGE